MALGQKCGLHVSVVIVAEWCLQQVRDISASQTALPGSEGGAQGAKRRQNQHS